MCALTHPGVLEVISNEIVFAGSGSSLRHPNGHPVCMGCGTCKMLAALRFRERHGSVAFVGEGQSDRHGALYSDLVFAKNHLVALCRRDGIPYVPWTDFDDVRRMLEELDVSGGGPSHVPGMADGADVSRTGDPVQVVSPPDLPPGLTHRAASMDDAPGVADLVAACEVQDYGDPSISLEDVLAFWRRPSVNLAEHSMLVFDGDRLVADAEVYGTRSEVYVHPSSRGRGIGGALLAWTERRALADRTPGQPFTIRQIVAEVNRGAIRLLETTGYRRTWESWVLERRLDRPVEAPRPPRGVRIRPAQVDDAPEIEAVYEVIEGSFREQDASHDPETYEDWRVDTVERDDFDPALFWVAVSSGEVVGACLAFPQPDLGWVHQLAVRRDRRRRGIGNALLVHAFGEFHRRGTPAVALSTNSLSGALDLYRRSGMEVTRTYRHYERKLRVAASGRT
jgi:mycothiol synthase